MRKTQKTPFSTARVSCHGRPRPSSRRFGRNSGSSNSPLGVGEVHASGFTTFAISFNRSMRLKVFMR